MKSGPRRWGDRPAAWECYKSAAAFLEQCRPSGWWFLSTALTCIRAATTDAGFKENDEIGELGFSPTMRLNSNTRFEFRIFMLD